MPELRTVVPFSVVILVGFILLSYISGSKPTASVNQVEQSQGVVADDLLDRPAVTFPQCSPNNHYVFIKTHKTGGSTIATILNCRVVHYCLTPGAPAKNQFLAYPDFFKVQAVFGANHIQHHPIFNSLENHVRYSPTMHKLVTQYLIPNATFFTILREPVSAFLSGWTWWDMASQVNHALKSQGIPLHLPTQNHSSAVTMFADNFETIWPQLQQAWRRKPILSARLWNHQLFDLGYPSNTPAEEANKVIAHLEERLSLILITERFLESLVLLRRHMCWPLEDVLYWHQKNQGTTTHSLISELPARVLDKLEQIQLFSVKVYRYFAAKFEKLIEKEESFQLEVQALEGKIAEVVKRCTDLAASKLNHKERQQQLDATGELESRTTVLESEQPTTSDSLTSDPLTSEPHQQPQDTQQRRETEQGMAEIDDHHCELLRKSPKSFAAYFRQVLNPKKLKAGIPATCSTYK
eukprot:m.41581 g.41581  ORF g.41581 m.41581 type:complete len:466 (-) comp16880_c0_seq1:46-1443(-)